MQREKRQAVVRLLEKEEVTDKVNPTPEDERRFYDSHLADFVQPEMRTVREIFIKDDSAKAAQVRAQALKGADFRKLALRYNEKESTKPDTGRLGPVRREALRPDRQDRLCAGPAGRRFRRHFHRQEFLRDPTVRGYAVAHQERSKSRSRRPSASRARP